MNIVERDDNASKATWPSKVSYFFEGLSDEVIATDYSLDMVTFRRPLPTQLIGAYVDAALRHANVRRVDEKWFAEVEGFPGVWAHEETAQEALDVLREAVHEWVLFKIRDNDRDLPVLESLDLNTL